MAQDQEGLSPSWSLGPAGQTESLPWEPLGVSLAEGRDLLNAKEIDMSSKWHEVARLGGAGVRYPHLLVDSHGWCLRLGPNSRTDEKYYSSLPMLLRGLLEHFTRRRLTQVSPIQDLRDLIGEVKDAFHSALGLCHEALEKGGLEEHIRRLGAQGDGPRRLDPSRAVPRAGIVGEAASGMALRKPAV